MNPQESELVLNEDGSVYHLKLKREHIAPNVILVGDPGRVAMISAHFDSVTHEISNREFVTHTGTYKGTPVTALATGIGTDNIDIVVNELDAAVNFDLASRTQLEEKTSLNLIRIGTCGGLQPDLDVHDVIISSYSIGLDGVKHFYEMPEELESERHIRIAFEGFADFPESMNSPYVASADPSWVEKFAPFGKTGITLTSNGFFGPQGRALRLRSKLTSFNEDIDRFEVNGIRALNYEMESSALFALGGALGHKCACLCLVVANRKARKFSKGYRAEMNELILNVLDKL